MQQQYNSVAASSFVVYGGGFIVVAIAALLCVSLLFMHNPQALGCLIACSIAGTYIIATYLLSRWRYYRLAAYSLILFYTALSGAIVWIWGINTLIGPLIFGLVIVLAGILLTAQQALWTGIISGFILVMVQTATALGWHNPDTSWAGAKSTFGDLLTYCVVFSMLALVSWLYNRRMERALSQAKHVERELLQQKITLKKQIKEQTKDLRRLQLDEMRQMYNFANLGQLGVTLLHDLANHITALTLEVEGIEDKRPSKEMARIQQITQYLSEIVDNTRQRLHGGTQKQTFNIVRKTNETINFLYHKAAQNNVTINWHPPTGSWQYSGDPDSFCQIIAILINNAIDAYVNTTVAKKRRVTITMQPSNTHLVIRISNWGRGITKSQRKLLFKPYYSNKKFGLGLGLYIAKQTTEMQFDGTVRLSPRRDHTEFIIKLPLKAIAGQAVY